MNPGRNQQIGKWGEDTAAAFLQKGGFTIVGRNVRTPYGELDIIAAKDDVVHFVEVKTRSGLEFGLPEEAITPAKRAHLLAAVQAYWMGEGREEGAWQVDVIAVIKRPGDKNFELEVFENAIQ